MLPTTALARHLRTYLGKVHIEVEDTDIFRLSLPSMTGLGTLTRWIYSHHLNSKPSLQSSKSKGSHISKPRLQLPKSKGSHIRKPISSRRSSKKHPKSVLRKFKRRSPTRPAAPLSLLQAKTLMMEEDGYYADTSSKGTTSPEDHTPPSPLPPLTIKSFLEADGDGTDCSWELIATARRTNTQVSLLSWIEEPEEPKNDATNCARWEWGSETTEIISPEAEGKQVWGKRVTELPDIPYDLIIKKISEQPTEIIEVEGERWA